VSHPVGLPADYHGDPGAELHEIGRRWRRGLPPGRRAVGRCQADGMTHWHRRGCGGANPERTAWQRPTRPGTQGHEPAAQD